MSGGERSGECPEVQPGRFAVRFADDLPDAVAC
jgi:hypothetical protein